MLLSVVLACRVFALSCQYICAIVVILFALSWVISMQQFTKFLRFRYSSDEITSTCWSHFKSFATCTRSSLNVATHSTGVPLRVTDSGGLIGTLNATHSLTTYTWHNVINVVFSSSMSAAVLAEDDYQWQYHFSNIVTVDYCTVHCNW